MSENTPAETTVTHHWDGVQLDDASEPIHMLFAREALKRLGHSDFVKPEFDDTLCYREGDALTLVGVLPIRPEDSDMTVEELDEALGADVASTGAVMCIKQAVTLAEGGMLPRHLRFDVMSVYLDTVGLGARIRHLVGVWEA